MGGVLPVMKRAGCALISTLAVLAIAAPATMAAPEGKAVAVSSLANGAKRIKYRVGPFDVVPGQNSNGFSAYAGAKHTTANNEIANLVINHPVYRHLRWLTDH